MMQLIFAVLGRCASLFQCLAAVLCSDIEWQIDLHEANRPAECQARRLCDDIAAGAWIRGYESLHFFD